MINMAQKYKIQAWALVFIKSINRKNYKTLYQLLP